MLYAQGSSSVVRRTAEVISDVHMIGQAVRQLSTMSLPSIESVWTELAHRPGTPLATMIGAATPPATQNGQAPFDVLPSPSPTSLNGRMSQPGSPILPGPIPTPAHRPSYAGLGFPPQNPGFAGQDDALSIVASVGGSSVGGRPTFTEEVNSIVNSGILDVAFPATFRDSVHTMPYTAAQPPSVSAPSELHAAFTRQSFESTHSNTGVQAHFLLMLSLWLCA